MNEGDVIKAFVAHLRTIGHPGTKIDRWPDKENRKSIDIDAIAGSFAIEHTSIDTLPNQRRDSHRFKQVVEGLKQELSDKLSFRLNVALEYDAIKRGQNWAEIQLKLKNWIIREAPSLSDGHHVIDDTSHNFFRLHVIKASHRLPGLIFSRFEPYDDTLSGRIREQLDKKAIKLAKYKSRGKITVILVESEDIALMNEQKMMSSLRKAYSSGLPSGVDQIWFADTSIPTQIEFIEFTSDLKI